MSKEKKEESAVISLRIPADLKAKLKKKYKRKISEKVLPYFKILCE